MGQDSSPFLLPQYGYWKTERGLRRSSREGRTLNVFTEYFQLQKMSYGYGAPPQNPWVTPGWAPRDPGAWALFQFVDTDRSGTVRLEELLQALTNGGYTSFGARTARYLMRMFDADRSGVLQYQEFEQLIGQVR